MENDFWKGVPANGKMAPRFKISKKVQHGLKTYPRVVNASNQRQFQHFLLAWYWPKKAFPLNSIKYLLILMILKQQLQLQLQLLHFESDKPPAWWAMTELIEEEFSGPLVRSGIWQLETVHPSSVIPTDEVWSLKSERELQINSFQTKSKSKRKMPISLSV